MTRFERLKRFAAGFLAVPAPVSARERWRAALGACLGLLLTGWLSYWLWNPTLSAVWLVAPMGASAVLVFALPASPLAQPWPVVGGNTVSALVGISCANLMGDPVWAAGAAVGLAIVLMSALRCLHPPGGATALLAVLLHATNYQFALFPVLTNSVLLVLTGVLYNHLTGRAFPHVQQAATVATVPDVMARFSAADLDAALRHYNQVLDVGRDDLASLLHHAELAAYQRNLGSLLCADIMSMQPVAVPFGMTIHEAWHLLRQHRIKALPVINRHRHLVGIVTQADFWRHAGLDQPGGSKASTSNSDVVGQIMTRKVQVASANRHVIELIPLFSKGGHQHIPIIDDDKQLVGIVTQSDLLRALYRAVHQKA
jgi:CBS domain-containing membrane protein